MFRCTARIGKVNLMFEDILATTFVSATQRGVAINVQLKFDDYEKAYLCFVYCLIFLHVYGGVF